MAAAEASILLFLQNNVRNPILTPIMQGITTLGDSGIFWVILTLILLAIPKTRKIGFCSALALVLSVLVNNMIIKNLVARTRPYEVIEGLRLITKLPDDYSFPSGHSAASFASAVAICRSSRRKAVWWLLLLAALIAFSRLYVGVHFPTDVLFGTISGILLGLLGAYLGQKIWPKLTGWIRLASRQNKKNRS